jgi:hypothetical protein
METAMPAEIMFLTSLVVAFFGVFALVLLFTDLTWDRSKERKS